VHKCVEMDELYWYVRRKPRRGNGDTLYIMTMICRETRQIIGYDVAFDKTTQRIQAMVDAAPPAEVYYSDGETAYMNVVYPGEHIRLLQDKSETYSVEGVNADLRHYIPTLARSVRTFPREFKTLRVVVDVFVEAYNRFCMAKYSYRMMYPDKTPPYALVNFL